MYVLDPNVRGRYSAQTTEERESQARGSAGAPEPERATAAANDEIPQQLTQALAAGEDGGEATAEAHS